MGAEEGKFDKASQFFHKNLKMVKGDEFVVTIPISDVFKFPNIGTDKNVIEIQVQNEVLEKGKTNINHLVDVKAQLFSNDTHKDEPVDIKDIINTEEGKEYIIHYIVYDLCNLKNSSKVELTLQAFDGKFDGYITAEVVNLQPFSVE